MIFGKTLAQIVLFFFCSLLAIPTLALITSTFKDWVPSFQNKDLTRRYALAGSLLIFFTLVVG